MAVSAPVKIAQFATTNTTVATTGDIPLTASVPAGSLIVLSVASGNFGRLFAPASSAGLTWTPAVTPWPAVSTGTAVTLAVWTAPAPTALTTSTTLRVDATDSVFSMFGMVAFYVTGANVTTPITSTTTAWNSAGNATVLTLPNIVQAAGGSVLTFGAGGGTTAGPLVSAVPTTITHQTYIAHASGSRMFHAAADSTGVAKTITPSFTVSASLGRFTGLAVSIAPDAPPPPVPGTVTWIWTGAPTAKTAVVHARTSGATSCRLAVSTSSDMSSPTYVAAQTPDTYGIVRYNVTGLTPNTRHYFRIADTPAGGTEALVGQIGTVRTLGAAGSVVLSRRVAIGGCLLTNTTETQALQAVNSWAPDWGHYNGDFFYNGNNETNEATWVGKYNSQIDNVGTHLKTLIASGIASYELVSDHDSTNADNADSNSPWAPYELAGWNKVVPHLAGSGDATSRDQQWDDGRVSYFMTDIRTVNRSPGLNTDDASKTMLGAAQKARLLNWLATNTAPFKVLITDSPWMGANDTVAKPDAWWSYDNERQQIISAVHAQSSHFEVWHGDSHVLGYATPAKNTWGGFPVLCAAPYYNDGGGRNLSTFSEYFNNGGTWASQYGRVTITDDGSKITRTFEGYDAFSSSVKLTYVTEVQAARAAYQIWDNGQLIPVEVLGVWNGTSITPVEVLGVWNGTSIDPVEGA